MLLHPEILREWYGHLVGGEWSLRGGPAGDTGLWAAISLCFSSFPSMAIGLSGFELSMVVMPFLRDGGYVQLNDKFYLRP